MESFALRATPSAIQTARRTRTTALRGCRSASWSIRIFDWRGDRAPDGWHHTVADETHVKGSDPPSGIPPDLRGTYAAIAHPASIDHFRRQIIHGGRARTWCTSSCTTAPRRGRGLRNYWGYNSIGFLSPHNEYAAAEQRGEQVQEFKQMVKDLHRAGSK